MATPEYYKLTRKERRKARGKGNEAKETEIKEGEKDKKGNVEGKGRMDLIKWCLGEVGKEYGENSTMYRAFKGAQEDEEEEERQNSDRGETKEDQQESKTPREATGEEGKQDGEWTESTPEAITRYYRGAGSIYREVEADILKKIWLRGVQAAEWEYTKRTSKVEELAVEGIECVECGQLKFKNEYQTASGAPPRNKEELETCETCRGK